MKMPTKHDKYLLNLCDKLKSDHDILGTNIILRNEKRALAEIDIIASKDNIIDIYEVKCSYRPHKAKKQLKRIKKLLELEKCRMFFYCGSNGLLEIVS